LIDRGSWKWIPIPAYLVEHPSAGAIVIDTGFHPSVQSDAAGNMGWFTRFGSFRIEHDQGILGEAFVLCSIWNDKHIGLMNRPCAERDVPRRFRSRQSHLAI